MGHIVILFTIVGACLFGGATAVKAPLEFPTSSSVPIIKLTKFIENLTQRPDIAKKIEAPVEVEPNRITAPLEFPTDTSKFIIIDADAEKMKRLGEGKPIHSMGAAIPQLVDKTPISEVSVLNQPNTDQTQYMEVPPDKAIEDEESVKDVVEVFENATNLKLKMSDPHEEKSLLFVGITVGIVVIVTVLAFLALVYWRSSMTRRHADRRELVENDELAADRRDLIQFTV